jgi:hypothetical protein
LLTDIEWAICMKSLIFALRTVNYLLFALWLFIWSSTSHLGSTHPTKPIPAEGRIYGYQDHYTVFYLTRREHLLFDFRTWVGVAFFMLLIGITIQKMDRYAKSKPRH